MMTAQYLRSLAAVRERANRLFAIALEEKLPHFRLRLDALDAVVDRVVALTRATYPDFSTIPVHARATHFDVGGVSRNAKLNAVLASLSREDQARAKFDLTVVSVLLDAGSGPSWSYRERGGGGVYARSEGLAVASYWMFMDGDFSSAPSRPLRADRSGLLSLSEARLAAGFQVSESNPIAGLSGRLALLHGVGRALQRPAVLFDRLLTHVVDGRTTATALFDIVMTGLGEIWPGRLALEGVNLGDTFEHRSLGPAHAPVVERLMPFHKLSQWLTYSLIPIVEEAGVAVDDLDALTGLPEYRNGGLFIDGGVLVPRNSGLLREKLDPAREEVVEWRALTVALLDETARRMRVRVGLAADDARSLSLGQILQGGTWSAGRALAAELRPGGAPPLSIVSDGTVF